MRLMLVHSISQYGAWSFVGVHPKTFRRSRPLANPEISKEMKAFAAKCRIGYRWIGVLSERMDMIMNHKKLYRLYTDEKSCVRQRRGRKRARELRMPMPVALWPGERWSLYFLSDTFGASRKLHSLAVNNDCCCVNLHLMTETSI